MQIEWVRFDREQYNPKAFAAVRQGAREGTLLDVATDQIFLALLMRNLRNSLVVEEAGNRLEFQPTIRLLERPPRSPVHIHEIDSEQCESAAIVDTDCVVKFYRKLEEGIKPAIEMGRFLTEIVPFTNTPALLGSAELVEGETRSGIAVVHAFIENQGDAWSVTSAYLDRLVDEQRLLTAATQPAHEIDEQRTYLHFISQAGRRLAELHATLVANTELPDFKPEPIDPEAFRDWIEKISVSADRVCDNLHLHRQSREGDRPLIDEWLAFRSTIRDTLGDLLSPVQDGLNIRHHGDLQLRRLLIVKDDVFVINFDGDPSRPLFERRRKAPAARDLAGLICSIDAVAAAALTRALKIAADEHGRVAQGLTGWRDRAINASLIAYRQAIAHTKIWPADAENRQRLLRAFVLERSLARIEHEFAHHEEWPRDALAAALRIHSLPIEGLS